MILSRFIKTQHVDVLKDQLDRYIHKLNNWLVLKSNKNIAFQTNQLLKEQEESEKRFKWIELGLEITILPYYLYNMIKYTCDYLYEGKGSTSNSWGPF